jgi:C4-dicarboxylate-specific signal transduction histidine kinase
MIDDSEGSFVTLRAMLAPGRNHPVRYTVSHTRDVDAGRLDMEQGKHDCYLIDYRLGTESGLDLVRGARLAGMTRPIVMLTASNMVEREAAEAGANDFLVKGEFDRPLLERTIRYAIGNAEGVRRLAELNASLEATIAERTAQYVEANRQLVDQIAAREQAEAALVQAARLQALGRMTGSVAHDFNNVLTALFGSLEVLGRRLGPSVEPRIAAPLATAVEAARLGERMVEGLLAFARRRPLAPRLLQINDVIAELDPLLRLTLGGVALTVETEPELAPVVVEREQLERTLLNLASNARDAMAGQRNACFALYTRTLGSELIELCAADNGPGMDQKTLEHAFEPFFTTKTGGQGTGLGLAQVYGFALQSGGTATIDSRPGAGVRVRLSIPVAGAPEDDMS